MNGHGSLLKRIGDVVGLLADMIPGAVLVAAGLALIVTDLAWS